MNKSPPPVERDPDTPADLDEPLSPRSAPLSEFEEELEDNLLERILVGLGLL